MKFTNSVLMFALLGAAVAAHAQTPINTSQTYAVPYEVGQGWVTQQFTTAAPDRWFTYVEHARRSYCIEAVQGSLTPYKVNPKVTAYESNLGTTPLTYQLVPVNPATITPVQNDNGEGDPFYQTGARACYFSTAAYSANTSTSQSNVRSFKVEALGMPPNESALIRIRVVDTTLMAPCHIRASLGPSGFPLITVSSNTSTDLRWVPFFRGVGQVQQGGSLPGTPASSTLASDLGGRHLSAYGSTYDLLSISSGDYSGTCYVAHNGPPGSVLGTVRTVQIDGTTALLEMKMK